MTEIFQIFNEDYEASDLGPHASSWIVASGIDQLPASRPEQISQPWFLNFSKGLGNTVLDTNL